MSLLRLVVTAFSLALATTSAEAIEVWTCSYMSKGSPDPQLVRFELSPPDLITSETNAPYNHYRIVQNNDYSLVATRPEVIGTGEKQPEVAASTVVINKATGGFVDISINPDEAQPVWFEQHGKCLKN